MMVDMRVPWMAKRAALLLAPLIMMPWAMPVAAPLAVPAVSEVWVEPLGDGARITIAVPTSGVWHTRSLESGVGIEIVLEGVALARPRGGGDGGAMAVAVWAQTTPTGSRVVLETARAAAILRADAVDGRIVVDVAPRSDAADPPLIMLDPGHGGRDPGAVAASGVQEKTIALAFAQRLAAKIDAKGRARAALTRDTDRRLPLPERVRRARALGASAFVSLHADSHADGRVGGFAAYVLSPEASDDEARALAGRENAVAALSGVRVGSAGEPELAMLLDLAREDAMRKARSMAEALLEAAQPIVPLARGGRVHGADFRVLRAPDVPSVLVELGFLSNAADLARLQDPAALDVLAARLAQALTDSVANAALARAQ